MRNQPKHRNQLTVVRGVVLASFLMLPWATLASADEAGLRGASGGEVMAADRALEVRSPQAGKPAAGDQAAAAEHRSNEVKKPAPAAAVENRNNVDKKADPPGPPADVGNKVDPPAANAPNVNDNKPDPPRAQNPPNNPGPNNGGANNGGGKPADPGRPNSGDTKVGPVIGSDRSNRPHVPCEFWFEVSGFPKTPAPHSAVLTITPQAPTKGTVGIATATGTSGATNVTSSGNTVSFTFVGGGPGSLRDGHLDLKLDLSRATSNAAVLGNQGYHVDLDLRVDGQHQPGKNKVVWVQPCGTPPVTPEAAPAASASTDCVNDLTLTLQNKATKPAKSVTFTVTPSVGQAQDVTLEPGASWVKSFPVAEDTTGTVTVTAPTLGTKTFSYPKNCAGTGGIIDQVVITPTLTPTVAPTATPTATITPDVKPTVITRTPTPTWTPTWEGPSLLPTTPTPDVRGVVRERGGRLPFTGASGLAVLFVLAVVSVASGVLLHATGRGAQHRG